MRFQPSPCSAVGTAAHTSSISTAGSSAAAVGQAKDSWNIPGSSPQSVHLLFLWINYVHSSYFSSHFMLVEDIFHGLILKVCGF